MDYSEFFRFLNKWRKSKRYPPSTGWPREIRLDRRAWDGIERLYKLTSTDGHEYETTFFYVEGDTILTQPLRGSKDQVQSNHLLQVKYEPAGSKYYRLVIVDNKVMEKQLMDPKDINPQTEVGYLFNMHTHPEHINEAEQKTYSFFSDTDIRSLLTSDVLVSGLITDKFWLVGKTDKAISQIGEVGVELLHAISEKAFAGENYLDGIIQQNMSRWGLVFYKGDMRSPLVRVN